MSVQKNLTSVIKPSKVRYVVLLGICLLYFISYLDRVTISVTSPKIMQEFHFDKVTMGFIFAAFSITYALFQVVGGVLGDRFGPRRILSLLMAWWSTFTILTGVVSTFISLYIVRFLFGLGEAGGFPVATRALASWFPRSKNGILQGTTHAASRLGAAIAPPVIVAIVIFGGGWRWAFYLLGALGLVWTVFFVLFFRNTPKEVAAVNDGEMALIREGKTTHITKPSVPWRRILRSKDVWALTFTYFTYGYTLWIYLTWLPTYLTEARHFSFAQLGIVASLPLFGGILGDFVGGWTCDTIYKKTGNLNLARRSLIVISFVGTVAFVIPSALVQSALLSEILTIGALFMLECAVSVCWAISMDLGGEHFSGSVSSIMNTGSGVASIIAPIIFPYMVQITGSWFPGFAVGSVLLIIGAITIFMVNARNTIEPYVADSSVKEPTLAIDTL